LQEWALAGTDIKIARIPYKSTGRQSKVALAWLLEKQEQLREWFQDGSICIRHAFNSDSEMIAEDGNRIDCHAEHDGISFLYQFYGCYWHGCTKCYDPDAMHLHFQQPYSRVYAQTQKKEADLVSSLS
jgi:hypothetical protein